MQLGEVAGGPGVLLGMCLIFVAIGTEWSVTFESCELCLRITVTAH